VYADLRTSDPSLIMRRQEAGVHATLQMLERLLKEEIPVLPGGGL